MDLTYSVLMIKLGVLLGYVQTETFSSGFANLEDVAFLIPTAHDDSPLQQLAPFNTSETGSKRIDKT